MDPTDNVYVVCGRLPWNRECFQKKQPALKGRWTFISSPGEMTMDHLETINPRYIFFLHWSEKVPDDIWQKYECVCFHMTDVPYGRGGSPLQNLILREHTETKLTALRMTADFDAGPVYMKKTLSLNGRAVDIYKRATLLSLELMGAIIDRNPIPKPQKGTPTIFKRRTPEQSRIPVGLRAEKLFDHIRMLDAPGYPPAFYETEDLRFEFSHARLAGGKVEARVIIKNKEKA